MSQGWARVSGRLLNSSRPFYVYAWKSALRVDLLVMLRLTGLPLSVGLILACLPFNANTDVHGTSDHALYAYMGMGLLGIQTGLNVVSELKNRNEDVSRAVCECMDWILFLCPHEHPQLCV